MKHISKDGKFKIVNKTSLPLTGKGVVDTLITEMVLEYLYK